MLRKLLKKQMPPPRVMITDKLARYGAAKRDVMPGVEHRQLKGLNNRAENSHQPRRRRERQIKQFKSAGQAGRFLSAHDPINNPFHLRRDHLTAAEHRASRTQTSGAGRKSAALSQRLIISPRRLTMPISWTTASQVDDAGADADRSAGGQGR